MATAPASSPVGASSPIDLRSDTVTRPTAAMRAVLAGAEVGDDVYGEDPTVNRLQEQVAALLGKEAALFVPSGTMANQLAVRTLSERGDEVLCGVGSHIQWYECGAAAALASVQLSTLGSDGLFTAEEVAAAGIPAGPYISSPPVRLLCLENTHNRGGGRVWPLPQLLAVCETARGRGLRLHLDGARLWNAAVALRRPPAELAAPFDTVSVCLSKGLGAPVGSLLCGSKAIIQTVWRYRRMYGGGMRQAGVLAAAGLYALNHHYERLAEDHDNARLLAAALAELPHVQVVPPETNIVLFDLLPPLPDAEAVLRRLTAAGVWAGAFGPRRIRLVTHLDVDRAACIAAAERLRQVLCAD